MAEDIKKIVFVDLARFIEEHNDVFVDFARFIEEHNEPKAELSLRTAVETYRILKSLKADYETGTSRNTVQAMASLGSSVAGNYAGAAVGEMIFNAFKLDRGARVAVTVGAIVGGIVLKRAGTFIFNKISDGCSYNVVENRCGCGNILLYREYKNEKVECKICENRSYYDEEMYWLVMEEALMRQAMEKPKPKPKNRKKNKSRKKHGGKMESTYDETWFNDEY